MIGEVFSLILIIQRRDEDNFMESKRKIVLVTSRFPFPMVGGFEIKNYHLIRELSKDYEVSAHFIQRRRPCESDIKALENYCSVQVHKPSMLGIFVRMVINIFAGKPLQNALYSSGKAKSAIERDLISADAAVCSVIRTCDYIESYDRPKFYDLADSLWQLYKNNFPISKGWRRFAFRIEASRLQRKELQLVRDSNGVLFFNQREAEFYKGARNVHVVPHGVSEGVFECVDLNPQYADGLSFIGKLNVAHNVDMVLWFSKYVLPLLPNHVRLYLIGSSPSSKLQALANSDSRIVIVGFLDDPYPVIRSSIASICPLQTGGGIQNKIIESLACGAITIASRKAMAPFDHPEDSGILVCDTPEEWVRTINELLGKPQRHQFRREIGRSYAMARYSWKVYGDIVRRLIRDAIHH